MSYWIAFLLISVLLASVALAVSSSGKNLHLLVAWIPLSALLGALGYLDWRAQTLRDTSLASYILGAVITPVVSLGLARVISPIARRSVQWITVTAGTFLTIVGVVAAAYLIGF